MEWLRTRQFKNKQPRALLSTEDDCDPQACYDSFKEHWQQAYKIILKTQQNPAHDDVLGVMNHLEQMMNLLIYDMKKVDPLKIPIFNSSQCLEYTFNENILDKLFQWGNTAGKYANAVLCEQLKMYENLLSHSRHILLVDEPFIRPLLKLLKNCEKQIFSKEVERFLVDLLYQISTLLMSHNELIDIFFDVESNNKFLIFVLLINLVHRDDSIGMRARDALLLCISMSKKNQKITDYILENSNFSVIIASGLSGLYSTLPNVLDDINVPDWHRLTPDDVNDIKGLSIFVTSLEFSNAIAQVAHLSIRKQLQEFMYKGFLIPVLGPRILQSNNEEQIASMAYFELILRTVTHPGLLYSLLQFLLKTNYDGQRLLDILIKRINTDGQLCLVTLALFETIIELNCEDLMLELVFQYLQPCLHLMVSQRKNLLSIDPYCYSFEKLLSLTPSCCDTEVYDFAKFSESDSSIRSNEKFTFQQSLYGKYNAYLTDARNKIGACQMACSCWTNSYNGFDNASEDAANCSFNSSEGSSIGYESLRPKNESVKDEETVPPWKTSSVKPQTSNLCINSSITSNDDNSSGKAGFFLSSLLQKLTSFLTNSIYVNLHLTGLISRLAIFPQSLLRTYLIEPSLVLQPNVPSLIQIIGFLKQKIEDYMDKRSDKNSLIKFAKDFLVEREIRLLNSRQVTDHLKSVEYNQSSEPFQRNGPKRRSLNLPSLSSMFSRRYNNAEPEFQLTAKTSDQISDKYNSKFAEPQRIALCAVILEEWIKELAAIAQEHTISQLTNLINE